MSQSTEFLLEQWGLWQVQGVGLGCVCILGAVQPRKGSNGRPAAEIDDTTACRVDRAVAALRARDAEGYAYVQARFKDRLSLAMLAQRLRVSRYVAQRRLESAVHWVDLALRVN